ncbi:MAG: nucleotide exchange factor GrpE [Candidatus Heimdallarchaeota archaeon]|nr:nucleotide exchange factor GrpE [Candidatus Heimdallarchaeota archaeon]MDH5645170.1 nucleotide exchange factor GrpE [Candidatus Heimdallarchaeota archaeon]
MSDNNVQDEIKDGEEQVKTDIESSLKAEGKSSESEVVDQTIEEIKKEEPVEMVEIPKKRLEELETAETRVLEEIKRERADAINYRKRLEKQRDEFAEIASIRVLTKLLNVKDDINRIIDNGKETIQKEHLEGIELLKQRIDNIFESEGVNLIKIKEGITKFDPIVHEAIVTTPVPNLEPNTIITLVNNGFKKGDRILRPAKVIISTEPPKPVEEGIIETSSENVDKDVNEES